MWSFLLSSFSLRRLKKNRRGRRSRRSASKRSTSVSNLHSRWKRAGKMLLMKKRSVGHLQPASCLVFLHFVLLVALYCDNSFYASGCCIVLSCWFLVCLYIHPCICLCFIFVVCVFVHLKRVSWLHPLHTCCVCPSFMEFLLTVLILKSSPCGRVCHEELVLSSNMTRCLAVVPLHCCYCWFLHLPSYFRSMRMLSCRNRFLCFSHVLFLNSVHAFWGAVSEFASGVHRLHQGMAHKCCACPFSFHCCS